VNGDFMTKLSKFSISAIAALSLFLGADAGKSVAQSTASASIPKPKYSESIEYTWPDQHVAVEFDRVSPDSPWEMRFRDSLYALEQAKEPGKTWDESASKCRGEECLRFIETGLTRFMSEKPGNKINEFTMEMQVNADLWSEVLADMRKALSGLKGRNPGGSFFPDSVVDRVLRQERASQTTKDITALLAKHGLIARDFGFASPPALRPSLKDRPWSEIAQLPDVGIDVPPELYATISERR
jgi:hypothetical protein